MDSTPDESQWSILPRLYPEHHCSLVILVIIVVVMVLVLVLLRDGARVASRYVSKGQFV
jgi:hypothetical protein